MSLMVWRCILRIILWADLGAHIVTLVRFFVVAFTRRPASWDYLPILFLSILGGILIRLVEKINEKDGEVICNE